MTIIDLGVIRISCGKSFFFWIPKIACYRNPDTMFFRGCAFIWMGLIISIRPTEPWPWEQIA